MKRIVSLVISLILFGFISVSSYSANGPTDPAGKGKGILGFGFGPGIGYYGGTGFGPAILVHYDHSIWKVGPGTISLGGQVGTSFFWEGYNYDGKDYSQAWTNIGFVARGAYHYGWDVPGLDTYAGFGFGTRVSLYSDDGDYKGKKTSNVGFLPTAFFGGSWYFNDLLGVNAEFGYNFAFVSVGLNFRIVK